MARNKVMQLWTAFVTAFLALCTALGLVTTTAGTAAAASVPQSEAARNTDAPLAASAATPLWAAWSQARSLPPTMKQRIRAEAHGRTPGCRTLPLTDAEEADAPQTGSCATGTESDTHTDGRTDSSAAGHTDGITSGSAAGNAGGSPLSRTSGRTDSPVGPTVSHQGTLSATIPLQR
ncbi:DUF6344 domain-containing protein [Streptomyces sp. NPDC005017]|uniref:DUF6344 domain-containing protein n=1 Tax=Streptomyces sp. NPDC005017 TaxID=3364706 RepID=UPI0036CB62B9